MEQKNPKSVVAGKKGSDVRWKPRQDAITELSRYDVIVELSKKFAKDYQDWFMTKWETEKLLFLLQVIQSIDNDIRQNRGNA